VPRIFVKYLGAPTLEHNFSFTEREREIMVAGTVGKRLIKIIKEILNSKRIRLFGVSGYIKDHFCDDEDQILGIDTIVEVDKLRDQAKAESDEFIDDWH